MIKKIIIVAWCVHVHVCLCGTLCDYDSICLACTTSEQYTCDSVNCTTHKSV